MVEMKSDGATSVVGAGSSVAFLFGILNLVILTGISLPVVKCDESRLVLGLASEVICEPTRANDT